MNGSFLPRFDNPPYHKMQELVSETIRKIFSERDKNFLSLEPLPELTVVRGDNNLSTCYQYAVTDATGCKVLGIKFYDKMIDLIGREATHLVGSRVSTIVGSCRSKDTFSQRLC